MLPLAAILASLIGLALGLLGGGGSILTLPMLVYVLHVDAKEAIASSLFVVGITSVIGVMAHARIGNVRWKIGGLFGAAGMAGAAAGGEVAHYLPASLLLTLFATMMLLTAGAMMRGRRGATSEVTARAVSVPKAILLGAAVGLVSGLVGAGGGFLVVPALVLIGGLAMPQAVGTSLLVIAMQSLAGFASHARHTGLHMDLLLVVAAASVVGSIVGVRLARHAKPDTLRRAFGWLVLAMGLFLLAKQLPAGTLQRPFVAPLLGGALIGLAASLLLWAHGKVAGISGLYGGLFQRTIADRPFRLAFVLGLLLAGAAFVLFQPATLAEVSPAPLPVVALAGALVGYGTRLGNGCTSGHGICGLSRFSVRSLVATATFMTAGAITVFVVHHVLGGFS